MDSRGIAIAASPPAAPETAGTVEPDWREIAAETVADLAVPLVMPEGWDVSEPPRSLLEKKYPGDFLAPLEPASQNRNARKKAVALETPQVDAATLVGDIW